MFIPASGESFSLIIIFSITIQNIIKSFNSILQISQIFRERETNRKRFTEREREIFMVPEVELSSEGCFGEAQTTQLTQFGVFISVHTVQDHSSFSCELPDWTQPSKLFFIGSVL